MKPDFALLMFFLNKWVIGGTILLLIILALVF